MIIIGPALILTSSLCVVESLHINSAYTGCSEWYYLAYVYCFEEELIIVAYKAQSICGFFGVYILFATFCLYLHACIFF